MQEHIRVYIAGPLSNSNRAAKNIHEAIRVADLVRAAGMWPFVPHLYAYWDTVFPNDINYWLEMGKVWLQQCHAVLRLPGESKRTSLEELWANEFKIPVFFIESDAMEAVIHIKQHFKL